ncbi:MAG: hypothetical protein ACR2HJ_09840 [Fimbriimonadales bacterium]
MIAVPVDATSSEGRVSQLGLLSELRNSTAESDAKTSTRTVDQTDHAETEKLNEEDAETLGFS